MKIDRNLDPAFEIKAFPVADQDPDSMLCRPKLNVKIHAVPELQHN